MWQIFFLIMALFCGAGFRMVLPKWLPYTVGLLMVGILLGGVAQLLAMESDCPMYALKHDADGDGYISESEWNHFLCVNCTQDSFCLAAGRRGEAKEFYLSTCGDGSAKPDATKCWYTFEWLDSPWKLSSMHAEHKFEFPTDGPGGHRRGLAGGVPSSMDSTARAGSPAGDGRLSPDELWTVRCNLLLDMISLKDIDPHMMLVVFLPALLYESAAFGIDMGIFLMQLPQILILAFPAMIVASGITAILLYAMAPASWTIWICWLIGVIASATDPVAVVALLKELGASKALGTLIEGESLLNDGSAVVLFMWVKNAIGYDYATLGPGWMRPPASDPDTRYSGQIGFELLRIVAQMLFLGCALGWLFGACTKFALKFVYNDRFVEASIIIAMSYFAFWLAELVMGSSAVLAVVVMGLYMNYNKSVISPPVLHFLHEFYEMVAHVLNTIIFLIAGCKLGALMTDSSFYELFTQGTNTRMMIICMYPVILVARGGAILLFFPLVRRLGTKCTWKDAVVMWWGGLRGSVGLALGLSVHHMMYDKNMWGDGVTAYGNSERSSLDCRDQPMMVLWLTVFVVWTTVIIQGVTMAPLMKLLNLTKPPDERNFMILSASNDLNMSTAKYVEELQQRSELSEVDWESVNARVIRMQTDFDIKDPDKAAWLLVLNLERAFYHAQFEDAVLTSDAFAILEGFMANLAAAAAVMPAPELGKLYDKMFYDILIHRIFHKESAKAAIAYEVGLAYLNAQAEVKHLLGHEHNEVGHDETAHGAHERTAPAPAPGAARRRSLHGLELVAQEHTDNVKEIRNAMRLIYRRHPDAVRHFETTWAKRLILNKQSSLIKKMQHEGILLDLDAMPLLEEVDHRLAQLYTEPLKEMMRTVRQRTKRSLERMATGHLSSTVHRHSEEDPSSQEAQVEAGEAHMTSTKEGAIAYSSHSSPAARTSLFTVDETTAPSPAVSVAAAAEVRAPTSPADRQDGEDSGEELQETRRNAPPASVRSYRVAFQHELST